MIWAYPSRLDELYCVFDQLGKDASVIALAAPQATVTHPANLAKPPREALESQESWLGMTSSGSTGIPRLVWKKWSELTARLHRKNQLVGLPWASSFQPSTYAGVMVALQAWVGGSKILTLGSDWQSNWRSLLEANVQAISCTPTFLDFQMQSVGMSHGTDNPWRPLQITLGGEPLRPALASRLSRWFPRAHFTVIYATAELGPLLKSHTLDGWYDLASLDPRFEKWRLSDGILELWIDNRWVSSNDQVEVQGTKMRIIGRGDNVANVAGAKVSLAEISRVAEEVPGVLRAIALAETSSVAGQIVCLKYCLETDGTDPAATQQQLEDHLRKNLRKEAWPRRWERSEVDLGGNSKRLLA